MSTARVLVTILEKELPYELIFVDIAKGEQKKEDYLKMQPFGKVPVMDDDGFVMFESRAICRYLARSVCHSHAASCHSHVAQWADTVSIESTILGPS